MYICINLYKANAYFCMYFSYIYIAQLLRKIEKYLSNILRICKQVTMTVLWHVCHPFAVEGTAAKWRDTLKLMVVVVDIEVRDSIEQFHPSVNFSILSLVYYWTDRWFGVSVVRTFVCMSFIPRPSVFALKVKPTTCMFLHVFTGLSRCAKDTKM